MNKECKKNNKCISEAIYEDLKKQYLTFNINDKIYGAILKGINHVLVEIEENSKEVADYLLKIGIYPSRILNINYDVFLKLEEKQKNKYLFNCIITALNDINIKEISDYFENNNIKVAYNLYKTSLAENYRLCVLSLLQSYNYTCNDTFKDISGEQRIKILEILNEKICNFNVNVEKIKARLKADNPQFSNDDAREIALEKYKNSTLKTGVVHLDYYIFIPFLISNSKNTLMSNDNKKYSDYLYNRNAIIHGYNDNFGTKENCLRYFSLIFNVYEVIKIYNKFLNINRGELDE